MAYTLKHEHPEFPTGEDAPEFGIMGLGRIKNGESLEIDEDMERAFVASHGSSVEDAFSDNSNFELSGHSTLSEYDLEQLLPPVPVEEEVPAHLDSANDPPSTTRFDSATNDAKLGGEDNA